MANTDDKPALKITLEDLNKVEVAKPGAVMAAGAAAAAGARQYGNISSSIAEAPVVEEGKSNFLLQGWFYLGSAGLVGALIGWGIAEPLFVDGQGATMANRLLIPSVVAFMCMGFGVSESVVERSPRKAVLRGLMSLGLGAVGGFIFDIVANIFFAIAVGIVVELGVHTNRNPAFWIARGLAWMVFGVAGGIIYGAVDKSGKKIRYGILGGVIGAGLGGMIFDPIAMATKIGGPSRGIGFALFGLATGVAMGIVESALKDRWLYVAAGPLAGKQFILYKPVTVIGSSQQSDIYLFKDASIQPQHASIELRGAQTFLHSDAQVYVSGQPARHRALNSGDLIQIGKYAFHFRERHRK
ncbi:MAG TPA: FHA domain-containing protein [Candidatus Angelobacter sp.]|nr:FHA domain-containing protein [Candidatus Angelobacter sp.]